MSQLQLTYRPEEDRLALQIMAGDEPVLIWLTRRMTLEALSHIEAVVSDDPLVRQQATPLQKKQILDFQQEAAISGGKLQQRKNSWAKSQQNVKQKALAVKVIRNSNQEIKFVCENSKALNLALSGETAHLFKEMLIQASKQANWGIDIKSIKPKPLSHDINIHYKASIAVN
jgi:hypothetical protein